MIRPMHNLFFVFLTATLFSLFVKITLEVNLAVSYARRWGFLLLFFMCKLALQTP